MNASDARRDRAAGHAAPSTHRSDRGNRNQQGTPRTIARGRGLLRARARLARSIRYAGLRGIEQQQVAAVVVVQCAVTRHRRIGRNRRESRAWLLSIGAPSVAEACWLSNPAELPLSHGGTDGGATGLFAVVVTATRLATWFAEGSSRPASPAGWLIINAAAATLAAITPPPDQRSQ